MKKRDQTKRQKPVSNLTKAGGVELTEEALKAIAGGNIGSASWGAGSGKATTGGSGAGGGGSGGTTK